MAGLRLVVSLTCSVIMTGLCLALTGPGMAQENAGPRLEASFLPPGQMRLSWPSAATGILVEETSSLTNPFWQVVRQPSWAFGNQMTRSIVPGAGARFYRLRQLDGPPRFYVTRHTPLDGARDVGVTFRPQIFFSQPVKPDSLSSNNFFATAGGLKLEAAIVPANDGSFAWLFIQQPMPGGTRVRITLDGSAVLSQDGNVLDADGDSAPGGILEYQFTTVSQVALPGTSLSGRVVDPGPDSAPYTIDDLDPGPDRQGGTDDDIYLLPIEGVKVFLLGMEDQAVSTDRSGLFHFREVPTGNVKVVVDGLTATNPPAGVYFPEMVIDAVMVAGKENHAMSVPEIYLPRLSKAILETVDTSQSNVITAKPEGAQGLSDFQRERLRLELAPDSFVGPDGRPLASAEVGISTVPPELVRDMLPPGVLQHTFDITVQAPGVATFSTPAPMTFPNVFKAPPGTQLNVLSFDHTTGRLVIEGTATVSADGSSVRTDPGTGITHPGWHGLTPPGSQNEPPCPPNRLPETEVEPVPRAEGLKNYLFHQETGGFALTFWNAANKLRPDEDECSDSNLKAASLLVVVRVEDGIASQFMDGVHTKTIELKPGQSHVIQGTLHPLNDLMFQPQFADGDVLFGVKVTIEYYKLGAGGTLTQLETPDPIFIYRYLDTSDTNHSDGRLMFPDALAEGSENVWRARPLLTVVSADAIPELRLNDTTHFSVGGFSRGLLFEPKQVSEQLRQPLRIIAPGGQEVGAGQLVLEGRGTPQFKLFFNSEGLRAVLREIADGADPDKVDYNQITPTERAIFDTESKRAGLVGEVERIAREKFAAFAAGLEFTESTGPNTIDVFWGYNALGGFGIAPNGLDDDSQIIEALSTYKRYTPTAQNYLMARALNNRFSEPVLVSVSQVLGVEGARYSLPKELGRGDLIHFLVKVVTHEAAHTLGAVHTSIQDDELPEYHLMIGGIAGSTDLMSYFLKLDGSQIFQQNFSREPLKLGTKIQWLPAEAQAALRLFVASTIFQFDRVRPQRAIVRQQGGGVPDLDGGEGTHLSAIPGPHLAIFDESGGLVSPEELVFVSALNPAGEAREFSLYNYGTVEVFIDAIHEWDDSGVFDISGLAAGDRIAPKQTKKFQVTFKSAASGEFAGAIEIASTDLTPIRLNLRGDAAAQGPDLRVSVTNHNLGGAAVGNPVQIREWGSLRNAGTEPLVIRSMGVAGEPGQAAFQVVALPPELEAGQPLTVAPGQAFVFGIQFSPARVGLQRSAIQIVSNDTNKPAVRVPLTGTGLTASGFARESLKYGNDYVAIETPALSGAPVLRARTDETGNFEFFLPAEQRYRGVIFDPASGLVAVLDGASAPSGQKTQLGIPVFQASAALDSDGDGLPDDIEFALGSDPNNPDTDGDGIDDFTAVLQGLDPRAGLIKAPAFVAAVPTQDTVRLITLAPGSADGADALHAYVAAGQSGVIIADVTEPSVPIILGRIDQIGVVRDVAVSPALGRAVVTSSLSFLGDAAARRGTRIYDVSDPGAPKELFYLDFFSWEVEIIGPYAYVLAVDDSLNGLLRAVNLLTGEVEQELRLAHPHDYMVRHEDQLILSGFVRMQVIDVAGAQMTARGELDLPDFAGRPAAHDQLAYFPLFNSPLEGTGGYATIEIPSLGEPKLLQGAMTPEGVSLPIDDIALNGSGRLLLGGTRPTGFFQSIPAIDLLDARDPLNTYVPLARFDFESDQGLAIGHMTVANGMAFVATGTAMLVFKFVDPDAAGRPPEVRGIQIRPDVDPAKPGPQVSAGKRIYISPDIIDDVQVRQVELLVDGQVVQSTVIAPFVFEWNPPAQTPGASLTIQVRATDTGGNSSLSAPVVVDLQ